MVSVTNILKGCKIFEAVPQLTLSKQCFTHRVLPTLYHSLDNCMPFRDRWNPKEYLCKKVVLTIMSHPGGNETKQEDRGSGDLGWTSDMKVTSTEMVCEVAVSNSGYKEFIYISSKNGS